MAKRNQGCCVSLDRYQQQDLSLRVSHGVRGHSPRNDTPICHCEGAPFAPEAISTLERGIAPVSLVAAPFAAKQSPLHLVQPITLRSALEFATALTKSKNALDRAEHLCYTGRESGRFSSLRPPLIPR
jgi:hypothetical protein